MTGDPPSVARVVHVCSAIRPLGVLVDVREVDGHRIPERSHAQLPRGVVEYASPEALIEGVPIDER